MTAWRKSTRCGPSNGCVETAALNRRVAVRDSKLGGASPVLVFGAGAWRGLLATVKAGRHDR